MSFAFLSQSIQYLITQHTHLVTLNQELEQAENQTEGGQKIYSETQQVISERISHTFQTPSGVHIVYIQ